jgi:hypothetical protein
LKGLNLPAEGWVGLRTVEEVERSVGRCREVEVIKYKWGQAMLDPILVY